MAEKAKRKKVLPRPEAKTSGTRKLPAWKSILFSVLVCVLFFSLAELVLAALGVRPVLFEEDPYVGFSSRIPLFVADERDPGYMTTAKNKLRFFNAQRFPRKKPANTYRVFCMGGSTTYGHPYDDRTSFCGWLRATLPKADPSRDWELINCGGISYASYRVALLMQELTRYEPDLFIVYSGQNEFLEKRTYGQIISIPTPVRGIGAVVSRTRTYAAMKRAIDGVKRWGASAGPQADSLSPEVDTQLDRSVGPEAYHRDDHLREQIVRHYRYNLGRMVDIARSAKADIIFVKPASNLRDCSPFKSEHRAGLGDADIAIWQEDVRRADAAASAGRLNEALAALDSATAVDDRRADLHYMRGKVLWEIGRFDEAKAAFSRAIDEDVCPLRALTSLQQCVSEVAASLGVPEVDFPELLAARSPHGVTGAEWFLDHVHPTIEGYQLLAAALLEAMRARGIAHPVPGSGEDQVRAVRQAVMSGVDARAHVTALRNLSKVFSWAGKVEEAYRLAQRGVEIAPDDPTALLEAGKSAAALGRPEEAIRYCGRALQINPTLVQARAILGGVLAQTGAADEAIRQLNRALELEPENAEIHSNLGGVLVNEGRLEQALLHFRRAVEILPGFAEAHSNLGWLLRDTGRYDEAIPELREALRLKPGLLLPKVGLAWILATHPDPGKRNPGEAVRLGEEAAKYAEEQDWMALDALGAAYASAGRFQDAARTAAKAVSVARSRRLPDRTLGELLARERSYENGKPFVAATLAPSAGR